MGVRDRMDDAIERRKLIGEVATLCPPGVGLRHIGWAVGYMQASDMISEKEALVRLYRMLSIGMKLPTP